MTAFDIREEKSGFNPIMNVLNSKKKLFEKSKKWDNFAVFKDIHLISILSNCYLSGLKYLSPLEPKYLSPCQP